MIKLTHKAAVQVRNGKRFVVAQPLNRLVIIANDGTPVVEEVETPGVSTPTDGAPKPSKPQPQWGKSEKDYQFDGGRGGYIIFDANLPEQKVLGIGLRGLGRWYQNTFKIPALTEEIISKIEQKHQLSLGYWLSQEGDTNFGDTDELGGRNSIDSMLKGKRMLMVMNVPDEVVQSLAQEVARTFGSKTVYIQMFGEDKIKGVSASGAVYDIGMNGGKAPLNNGKGGFIIMSADKNERENWRKRKMEISEDPAGVPVRKVKQTTTLTPQAIMSSAKGWLQTWWQRVNRGRNIKSVEKSVEKDFGISIKPYVSKPGHGGYLERSDGSLNREESFLIRVPNIPNDALESLARNLAAKFHQESVLVVFLDSGQKKTVGPDKDNIDMGLMSGYGVV